MEVTFHLGLENEEGSPGSNKQKKQHKLLPGDKNTCPGQLQLCAIVINKKRKKPVANN